MKANIVIPLNGSLHNGKKYSLSLRVPAELFLRGLKEFNDVSDKVAFDVMCGIISDQGWSLSEAPGQSPVGRTLEEMRDRLDDLIADGIGLSPEGLKDLREEIFG